MTISDVINKRNYTCDIIPYDKLEIGRFFFRRLMKAKNIRASLVGGDPFTGNAAEYYWHIYVFKPVEITDKAVNLLASTIVVNSNLKITRGNLIDQLQRQTQGVFINKGEPYRYLPQQMVGLPMGDVIVHSLYPEHPATKIFTSPHNLTDKILIS